MSNELLQQYIESRSEQAFTELVRQHIDLVYSAALRQVNGDDATAQDVTQAVFTDLARKAPGLARHTSLTGWLYTSTRFLAARARRADQRRKDREQEAHHMNQLLASTDPSWDEMRPVLDEVMHELGATDREAVLMRYFERRRLADIGLRLGLNENAARMRVERALDKLRAALARRGITSTLSALAVVLGARAVSAAPASLANQVSRTALAAGTAGGITLLCMKLATPTNLRLLAAASCAALVAGWFAWSHHVNHQRAIPSVAISQPMTTQALVTDASATTNATGADHVAATLDTTNKMVLEIVTDDTGKPVPNVALDYWVWDSGKVKHKKALHASRFGKCDVPVPRATINRLILVSQTDGFADTRLEWNVENGAIIPEHYTLRLQRAVRIAGQVVDADGKPVSGAQVGFNNDSNPAQEKFPESRNFGWPFWITATTDAEGRWQMERLAKDTLRTIRGGASHSNYTGSAYLSVNRDRDVEKQLLEGSYVFHLGRAVTVEGIVLGLDNQPISGADVLIGDRGNSGSRETKSLADGSFRVGGCQPGKSLITAQAKGFSPQTMSVNLEADSPFRITLQPGKILRVRVVDSQGRPIPNAQVWLDTFDRSPGTESQVIVQAEFSPKTDADGRILWESAPDGELTFDFAADGFMRLSGVKVRPDGQEHLVTLSPGLTVSGTVRDADTGRPIPKFRLITGWAEANPISGETNQHWSDLDRFWLTFEGGNFRHTYDEPVIVGVKDLQFIFKVEADGYSPAVTRAVSVEEKEARLDVRLNRATPISAIALLPDGQPAANADIGLVSPGAQLRLVPGGFDRGSSQSGSSLLEADEQGRFSLTSDASVKRIIVAHPDGYAQTTLETLAADPNIQLQPWGRLEGVWLEGGQPKGGHEILFEFESGDYLTISTDFERYKTKTDAEGHFTFPQVPAGRHKLVELVQTHGVPGGIVWMHEPLQNVEIQPGQTTRVTLGGSGNRATAEPLSSDTR